MSGAAVSYIALLTACGLVSAEVAFRYSVDLWPKLRKNGHGATMAPLVLSMAVVQAGNAGHCIVVGHYLVHHLAPAGLALSLLAVSAAMIGGGACYQLAIAWSLAYSKATRAAHVVVRIAVAAAIVAWVVLSGG